MPENTAAFLSAKVVSKIDLGSHTLFLADVTDGDVLGQKEPVSYSYYQANIKPKPEKTEKKGYRCKICGYVYDPEIGDADGGIAPGTPFEEIPDDWACPVCGVGKDMFEAQ